MARGHARPVFRATEGPLEMNSEHARLRGDGASARPAQAHFFRRIGDQRRQQAGRSELPMRRRDRANASARRLIVEQHVAAAVHLHIDEPGRQPCAFRQDVRRHGSRQVRTRHDLRDAGAVQRSPPHARARRRRRTHDRPRWRAVAGSLIWSASPFANAAAGRHRCRDAAPGEWPARRSSGSGKQHPCRDGPAPARASRRRLAGRDRS